MKTFLITILFLLISISFSSAQGKLQPRVTGFRTAEETENDEWKEKISIADTSANYIIQLVTSKNKADYFTTWICVQVIDRETEQLVQEIDLSKYDEHGSSLDKINIWDINDDGYEDFSLFEASYNLNNTTSRYFLFDPETETFFDSGFEGTNLEFHDGGIVTSISQCCAGTSVMGTVYKLKNNKLIVLEEHCMEAVRDSTGSPILDNEDFPIFEEIDCHEPYIVMQLQSQKQQDSIKLRMAVYDENMLGGYVLYDGENDRIPIHFNHSELIKAGENVSADTNRFFYDEVRDDKITGTYSFVMQGTDISDVNYIDKKDNIALPLQIADIK